MLLVLIALDSSSGLLFLSKLQIECWNLAGVKSRLTMEWCAVILVRMDLSESERTSFSGLFFSNPYAFC